MFVLYSSTPRLARADPSLLAERLGRPASEVDAAAMQGGPMPSEVPRRAAVAHRSYGPKVWERARAEYEGGQPASLICKAYGIGLSTFRERAAREGWRRCDAEPDMSPADADRLDALGDTDDDPHALTLMAWRRFALAVRDGDRLAARAWLRLHRELGREMRELWEDMELGDEYARLRRAELEEEPVASFSLTARDEDGAASEGSAADSPAGDPDQLDGLDDLDGVFHRSLEGGADPSALASDPPCA
jgi:hypothetical protein